MMITRVAASCGDCGTIEVLSPQITVYTDQVDRRRWCEYYCPKCQALVSKPVNVDMALTLVQRGSSLVQMTHGGVVEQVDKGRIRNSEVMAFRKELKTADVMARVLETAHDLERVKTGEGKK